MSEKEKKVIFKFCCYEIEQDEEDMAEKKKKKKNNLMVGLNEQSGICFSSSLSNVNIPIYKLLEDLYEGEKDISEIIPIFKQKRINPQISEELTERDDLEYYVPQLITFMTIQCNLENTELNLLIIKACMTHFYFAHSVYFYLQSLSKNSEGDIVNRVHHFIEEEFLPKMLIYSRKHLSGHELTRSMIGRQSSHITDYHTWKEKENIAIRQQEEKMFNYGTEAYPDPAPEFPPAIEKVKLKSYNEDDIGFMETPKFWNDLTEIGLKISEYSPDERMAGLKSLIQKEINCNLPATVYIPFSEGTTKLYTILNVWPGRVFSTKERAPFSVWIELYREQEEQNKEVQMQLEEEEEQMVSKKKNKKKKNEPLLKKIYETLSKPFSVADGENTLKIKNFVMEKKQKIQNAVKKRARFKSFYDKSQSDEARPFSLTQIYESKSDSKSAKNDSDLEQMDKYQAVSEESEENMELKDIFPKPSIKVIEDFKKKSIYRNLKSWKMMHMMVKTGDDLRQQQFAMQLIGKFQYIFEKEKVECFVKPYEVVSLGPDYGLIEMLNDITTFDSLFKKIGAQKMTLKDFFNQYFKDNKTEARKNFMKSLAGYSIVTYFLQVKDRHNGNILLHRDGSIIHIDFGFFLSNAPGKGVELEKKVPFKLLTEYVEVLGSLNSEMFFEFRRMFYKGFQAILKNRIAIISMIKMMFKSHGDMMSCFTKGQRTIEDLENRFHPPPGSLQDFCYNLINNSLDNWRAKWYDKFQYFLQKIYY